jgi:uncharacterized protein DUF5994
MTSVSSTSTEMDSQRLSLKPEAPTTGLVDGAWWPASRDLAAELPALAAAVTSRLGPVEAVSYNIDAWDATPRRVGVGGGVVRMAGYHTQARDTVDVRGARHLLTLLVVPPDTEPRTAAAALAAAGRAGNTDGLDALLAH